MTAQYKGVPEGASAIIPRLYCHDVQAQIEFCGEVIGAVEGVRRPGQTDERNMRYCYLAHRCS